MCCKYYIATRNKSSFSIQRRIPLYIFNTQVSEKLNQVEFTSRTLCENKNKPIKNGMSDGISFMFIKFFLCTFHVFPLKFFFSTSYLSRKDTKIYKTTKVYCFKLDSFNFICFFYFC